MLASQGQDWPLKLSIDLGHGARDLRDGLHAAKQPDNDWKVWNFDLDRPFLGLQLSFANR